MSIIETKALSRRWLELKELRGLANLYNPETAINKMVRAVAAEVFATNAIVHPSEGDQMLEQYLQRSIAFMVAFPDYYCTINDIVTEEDRVVTHFTVRGTHHNPINGIPATGKKIKITGNMTASSHNSRLTEIWIDSNLGQVVNQLGEQTYL